MVDQVKLVSYIDESRKPMRDRKTGRVCGGGEHYVVAAAVLLIGDTDSLRQALVELAQEITGARHLRWKDMSPTRRSRAIEAISDNSDWEHCLYETAKPVPNETPDEMVRARTLRAAFHDLSTRQGVARAVLETRAQPARGFTTHDQRDHRLLASMLDKGFVPREFRIEHRGKEEPLLWLADILAGARSD